MIVTFSIIFIFVCADIHPNRSDFDRFGPFSLISMFWPFPDFLVPPMTSALKNQYPQLEMAQQQTPVEVLVRVPVLVLVLAPNAD
jgi:hypothetical protein